MQIVEFVPCCLASLLPSSFSLILCITCDINSKNFYEIVALLVKVLLVMLLATVEG